MVVVRAGNGESVVSKKEFGRVLDAPSYFVVHVGFAICRISEKNSDFQSHVLFLFHVMGHPDSGIAAVAELMLDTKPLG